MINPNFQIRTDRIYWLLYKYNTGMINDYVLDRLYTEFTWKTCHRIPGIILAYQHTKIGNISKKILNIVYMAL